MDILLVSHGQLCSAMKDSVEMILGPDQPIYPLPLLPEMGVEEYTAQLKELVDQHPECVIIVDLAGGTPCHAAMNLLMNGAEFHLYAGMNMAMVIGLINDIWLGQEPNPVHHSMQGIQHINEMLVMADDEDE